MTSHISDSNGTAHGLKYKPSMQVSVRTERLTEALRETKSGDTKRLQVLSELLARIGERLLEAGWTLGMVQTLGQLNIMSCLVATDGEDTAMGNVVGRAREILNDVVYAAGHVEDYAANRERDDPLQGWEMARSAWMLKTTTAAIETEFNNSLDDHPDELWPTMEVGVESLIGSIDDMRSEAQSAKAYIDHLLGVAGQPAPTSVPTRPATRKPAKAATAAQEVHA